MCSRIYFLMCSSLFDIVASPSPRFWVQVADVSTFWRNMYMKTGTCPKHTFQGRPNLSSFEHSQYPHVSTHMGVLGRAHPQIIPNGCESDPNPWAQIVTRTQLGKR